MAPTNHERARRLSPLLHSETEDGNGILLSLIKPGSSGNAQGWRQCLPEIAACCLSVSHCLGLFHPCLSLSQSAASLSLSLPSNFLGLLLMSGELLFCSTLPISKWKALLRKLLHDPCGIVEIGTLVRCFICTHIRETAVSRSGTQGDEACPARAAALPLKQTTCPWTPSGSIKLVKLSFLPESTEASISWSSIMP